MKLPGHADAVGVVGTRWFTVRDNKVLCVHADDGDFYHSITIDVTHPRLELMVRSAVCALSARVKEKRRESILRNIRQVGGTQ